MLHKEKLFYTIFQSLPGGFHSEIRMQYDKYALEFLFFILFVLYACQVCIVNMSVAVSVSTFVNFFTSNSYAGLISCE